jgi:UDP-N-acetylmuramyl pentapeptide phosphotransferase/UDP-N-acetylglucosamine-1-phosphate transferase
MFLYKIFFLSLLTIVITFIFIKNHNFFLRFTDNELNKPQAFHRVPTLRIGGLILYLLSLFCVFFYIDFNIFLFSIITLGSLFFLIGFFEDIKFKISPITRLILMMIFSYIIIYYLNIKILNTQFIFLNNFISSNRLISSAFVCLCLLFIVNGCNLVDGFNGLLLIHFLIISLVLLFIDKSSDNFMQEYLKFLIIINISILFFNFPKAQIFLGDGGAYYLGVNLSLIVIKISNLNNDISPFFFAGLLFYLFFEVLFSFFRKFIFNRSSPLNPDNNHLHMLVFKHFYKKNNNLDKSNYLTSIIINFIYLIFIIPLILNYKNQLFCTAYFIFLIFVYLYFYRKFYFKKN